MRQGRGRDKGFVYDERAGDHPVRWFARYLRHVKGVWAGSPLALDPWQSDGIIRPLFGWQRPDRLRRYRTAYVEIPKKNGKSTISAGVALYLLFADNEPGGEVYSAAGDRDQAAIVFEMAKRMVELSPALMKRARIYKRSIYIPATGSVYKVLSADAPTKHGINAHGIIFDELHVQPNRELWDTLVTSTAARAQPLVLAITTAGYDRNSICWEQHDYSLKVVRGIVNDPTHFAYMAYAEEDEDWTDPDVWKKANPGVGKSVRLDYLEKECGKARETPAYENTFRRLHLNQWTQQATRWMPIAAWDETAGMVVPEKLKGRECYAGLDLASSTDIAALVLTFPEKDDEPAQVLCFFWIPRENIASREKRDRVSYSAWVAQGLIEATEGNAIDYGAIKRQLSELRKEYNIKELAYDRWGAVQLSQELEADGMTVVPVGQGFAGMSGPTKELEKLVLSKKLAHGGNPVLRWMADNMTVRQDPAGNLKPDRSKSTSRIDGMVALIMAIDRMARQAKRGSIYDEREPIVLESK